MTTSFSRYRMPAEVWARMESILPKRRVTTPRGGRPPVKKLKPVADAIFYKMRTGCQWNAIPRTFAPSSTAHDYFQRWVKAGVFEKLWEVALTEYDELKGISWKHQSLDSALVRAPLGGEKNGAKPDRPFKKRKQALSPGRRKRNSTRV